MASPKTVAAFAVLVAFVVAVAAAAVLIVVGTGGSNENDNCQRQSCRYRNKTYQHDELLPGCLDERNCNSVSLCACQHGMVVEATGDETTMDCRNEGYCRFYDRAYDVGDTFECYDAARCAKCSRCVCLPDGDGNTRVMKEDCDVKCECRSRKWIVEQSNAPE